MKSRLCNLLCYETLCANISCCHQVQRLRETFQHRDGAGAPQGGARPLVRRRRRRGEWGGDGRLQREPSSQPRLRRGDHLRSWSGREDFALQPRLTLIFPINLYNLELWRRDYHLSSQTSTIACKRGRAIPDQKKLIIFWRCQSSIRKTKPCSVLIMLFIFYMKSLFQWKTSCFARSRILSGGDAREFTMTVLRAPQQTYQTLPAAVSLWSLWQRRSWLRMFFEP